MGNRLRAVDNILQRRYNSFSESYRVTGMEESALTGGTEGAIARKLSGKRTVP